MIYFLIIITSGTVLSLQKVVNAALGQVVGSMTSSFFNHAVGAVFASLLLALGLYTHRFHFDMPFYLFLGGCCGVFLVYLLNSAIPKIGAMATLIFVILSQLVFSACIDHFGLFQARPIAISPFKILGVFLLMLSAILVLSKPKA